MDQSTEHVPWTRQREERRVVAWKFIASQPYLGREIAGTDLSSLPNFLYLSELPRSVGLLGPGWAKSIPEGPARPEEEDLNLQIGRQLREHLRHFCTPCPDFILWFIESRPLQFRTQNLVYFYEVSNEHHWRAACLDFWRILCSRVPRNHGGLLLDLFRTNECFHIQRKKSRYPTLHIWKKKPTNINSFSSTTWDLNNSTLKKKKEQNSLPTTTPLILWSDSLTTTTWQLKLATRIIQLQ